nr:hypothetical protein [Polymorphobacter sp.]
MAMLVAGWGLLRGLPRPVFYALGVVIVLLMLWRWHGGKVDAAFAAGSAAQAATDKARFEGAGLAAAQAQAALVASLAAKQSRISKGTEHALVARHDDLARRYDDLRLRWAAHRAGKGGAGNGGTTAVSEATGGTDDARCAAEGWVSFDTAAAAAQAADRAIAKDDAWIAWVGAQARAWPE